MKTKLSVYLIVLLSATSISCDVVDLGNTDSFDEGLLTEEGLNGPTTSPDTREEILNLLHNENFKEWEAEGFTLMGFSGLLPCRLDDSMTLMSDGTYQYDGGNSLCGAEDNARIKEGTWELSDDLQSIDFTEGTNTYTAQLIGITSDQITLRGAYQGLSINAVYTSN